MLHTNKAPSRQQHVSLRRKGRPNRRVLPIRQLLSVALCFLFVVYVLFFRSLVAQQRTSPDGGHGRRSVESMGKLGFSNKISDPPRNYTQWRELVLELAALPAASILQRLESDDPFGVRTFEKNLLERESQQQSFLTLSELQSLFPCPKDHGIRFPDQRNPQRAEAFRSYSHAVASGGHADHTKQDVPFLFFQHLRKAGGTNFCSLAQRNLPRKHVPKYYCMPDYHWPHPEGVRACAGCLSHWTNEQIIEHMNKDEHLIWGNEWDAFEPDRCFDLPAILATSFRRPLDRALSQFRFECIEDRGCHIKTIEPWWERRKDLKNVYVWTFTDDRVTKDIREGQDPSFVKRRQEIVGKALDVVARFHLILVMEWLAYAPKMVTDVLGFSDTSALTERVRPHIHQFAREDGQEQNSLGAAGIAKASWSPKEYLSPEQYKIMSEDLALDEILTDAARRFFLERVVCSSS